MPRKTVRESVLISTFLIGFLCLFFLSNYFQTTAQTDTPSIAYIYSDAISAVSYESFLDSLDYEVDLINLDDITQTNLSYYSLIIIGPETGYTSEWGNSNQIIAIKNAFKPIIGLGEGGYAFFGKLDLDIGYGNGVHGSDTSVTVVDNSHSIFRDKNFSASESIQLYSVVTTAVMIYIPSPGENVVLLGRKSQSQHYPIIQEKRFLLWGFGGSPETMTQIGKDLFIEIVTYLPSQIVSSTTTPVSTSTTTPVPSRTAYIYSTSLASAQSFELLLDANNFPTDLIQLNDITTGMFDEYTLIIIGSDTGNSYNWGDTEKVSVVNNAGKRIIGLGAGGSCFFHQIGGLLITYGQCWVGYDTGIYVMDSSHNVFSAPNTIGSGNVQLYSSTSHYGVYLPDPPSDIILFGREIDDNDHYPIVQEKNRYLLWGFTGSPLSMTQEGEDLFINVVTYLASYSPQNIPTPSSIFGLVVIIISLLVTLVGIYVVALNVYIKPHWPVVDGTIKSCKVKKNLMEVNDQPRYHVVILISYNIGGSSYEVKKSSGRDTSSYSLNKKYSKGKKIALHYNPRNPKQIALEPDVRWTYGIFPVITLLIINFFDFSTNLTFLGIPLVFLEDIVELVFILNVLMLIAGAIYSFQDRTQTWEEKTEKKIPPIITTCHRCGKEIAKEADFCTKCGTKLEEEPIYQKKTYIVTPEIIAEKEEVEPSIPSLKPSILDVAEVKTAETSPTIGTTTKEDIITKIHQEKPVRQEISAKFSSIQYLVQDIIFESDSFVKLIPYSGSIREISVEFSQNHVIMSGCLTQKKIAISNLEMKIEGEPRPYSWDNPWQDITLLGEEKIINRLKNRTELANRLTSLGTAVLKVNTIPKGDICIQVTCNDNDDVIKNAYSLITDIKSFIEISLY